MINLVIGTAGHVDHGKTSLIKALTGFNTDTLKEEQIRGITVNLGFTFLKLDNDLSVGIVDVPGHEKLIKNMLAGVCGINLILLTVAVDDGIMPQTREHMEIIGFLNVQNIIVVLTKIDLVSRERIEEVKKSISEEFKLHQFVEFSIHQPKTTVSVINVIKENIKLEKQVEEKNFRMPIDRVFNVKGQGVVITGSSLSGVVSIGDELEILPTKQKVKVRGIQSFKQQRQRAYKHMRIALNLGGIKKEEVQRGKIVVTKDAFSTPSKILDVKIKVSASLSEPIKNLEHFKFYYLASEIRCSVKLINRKQIKKNEVIYGQLLLDEAIYASNKDLGVLRSINPIKTVAGIEIINVFGEYVNRKDNSFYEMLSFYENGDINQLTKHYINKHPFVKLKELREKLNLLNKTNEELKNTVKDVGIIFEDDSCLTSKKKDEISTKICELLKNYHHDNPHDIGMSKQSLQHEINLDYLSNRTFSHFLMMIDDIKMTNDKIKLSTFSIKYSSDEQKIVDAMIKYIDLFAFKPPKLDDILNNIKGQNVKSIYYSLLKEKELILIENDIVLTKNKYKEMIKIMEQFFKKNRILQIADGKELLNTSRKYIVAFSEYLDKVGYTRRIEEGRVKKV